MTKRYFNEGYQTYGNPDFLPSFKNFFSGMKKDDLIILGIILILLGDGCEDKELLLMLGFLFVSDKINLPEKSSGDN